MSCLEESVFVFLAACIGIRQCCPISDHNSRSHHQCPQKHQPPSLLPGHIFCPHQRGHRYRLPTDWHCRHWPRQRMSYTQPFYDGLLCLLVSLLIFYTYRVLMFAIMYFNFVLGWKIGTLFAVLWECILCNCLYLGPFNILHDQHWAEMCRYVLHWYSQWWYFPQEILLGYFGCYIYCKKSFFYNYWN